MISKFKIDLIEKSQNQARVKKGNAVVVSFEKETENGVSSYRAGKGLGNNNGYLFEALVSNENNKSVKLLNVNNSLSEFVDDVNVKQEGDYVVFNATEIKCLPNAQILISVKGNGGKISNVEIHAGEIVVNKGKAECVQIPTEKPINIELSENFFEDLTLGRINCGVLPAQAFEATKELKGVRTKVFNVAGEEIKFLTVLGEPNKLFMASGTEIRELANLIDGSNENIERGIPLNHDLGFQFRGGDFGQGKVGAVASILEGISSENAKEVLNYVKEQNSRTSVERVSSETYKTRIKNVSNLKIGSKSQQTGEFGGKVIDLGNEAEPVVNFKVIAERKSETADSVKENKINNDSDEGAEVGIEPSAVESNKVVSEKEPEENNAEVVGEVVAEEAKEENASTANTEKKQESQTSQSQKEETEENKNKIEPAPQYSTNSVRVPFNPLKVVKHCVLGGIIAGVVALTIAMAVGGLLFPAFIGLAIAIGTSTIMSKELVDDLRERNEKKQKAINAKKKSLEKEIDAEEKKLSKNKENQESKDGENKQNKSQESQEKEQDDEENLDDSEDKKKKKKKAKKIELPKFIKPKKVLNKEKVDESKAKAAVGVGSKEVKKEVQVKAEKAVEAKEEKTKVKKSSRQEKREAELNAIRRRITEQKTLAIGRTDAPAKVEETSSKADGQDLGM